MSEKEPLFKRIYLLTAAAIATVLILTVVSALKLCSEQCKEGHTWRLFHLPFEVAGFGFVALSALFHYLGRSNQKFLFWEFLLAGMALGAEIMFIIVQKYYIGAWCPVCLGIAATIAVMFLLLGTLFFNPLNIKANKMNFIYKTTSTSLALTVGFLTAFFGTAKFDPVAAEEKTVQESLIFGKENSNIEVYLFSDWACPACRKLEPKLEYISGKIMEQAKLVFVDHVIHPETLNYIPYHLAFIIKNKPKYFQLRDMLSQLSEKTGEPTDDEVEDGAAKLGVKLHELKYADISYAIKYFKSLGERFNVNGTPTMVIINTESKKGKKLSGVEEITEENALKAINDLNQTQ